MRIATPTLRRWLAMTCRTVFSLFPRCRNLEVCHCEPVRTLVWQSVSLSSESKEDVMFIYILANETNVCLYTGVTNDLVRRLYEHKNNLDPKSFTAQYHIHKLVYYEEVLNAYNAIEREKQIKGWNRKRKNKLIESVNPKWLDLSESWSDLIRFPACHCEPVTDVTGVAIRSFLEKDYH